MGNVISKLIEAYAEVNEKKKLDPVGQADADIDNDGDVDKSDKYLHNRRKAVKKAMKDDEMKEAYESYGENVIKAAKMYMKDNSCTYEMAAEKYGCSAEQVKKCASEMYKKEEVEESSKAALAKKLAKAAAPSEKGKKAVTLKKAPFDIPKEERNEEEIIMNPKKDKDKKAEAETMANESFDLDEATGKEISSKMMKSKTMKAFASKVAKMPKVTRDDLEKMLPDYISGADITKLFKESVLPPVYTRIMENRAKQMKGATPPEGMMDNSKSSKGAMDMVNQPKEINDDDEKGHEDASKAGRVGPSAKARPADNMKGDKKVIPSATPMKGK